MCSRCIATRLGLVVLAAAVVWTVSFDPCDPMAEAEEISFKDVPADRFTGEPYELAGKRLVFTNWYFVRTGSFSWTDDKGNGVSASRQAKIGPWGAHFRRGSDAPWGIRLAVERPQSEGPIVKAQRPWEQMGLSLRCMLKVGDTYRAWASSQAADGSGYNCYFESRDGRNWQRPNLGLVEFHGSKENNLLSDAPSTVFLDPTAPAESRYKGVGDGQVSVAEFERFIAKHPDRWEHRALRKDAGFIAAVFGYVSPDGLHWTRLPEPFTVEHSDTQIVAGINPRSHRYMIFTRNYFVGPRSPKAPPEPMNMGWLDAGRRSIGYTESDHFGDFPLSALAIVPRPNMTPSELLYTNCYTTIPGGPDLHLLFPTVWDVSDDSSHLEIASSHNAHVWNWLTDGPLMTTGEFGRFDGGCTFWHPNLLELPCGDFVLPYTGYQFPHKYPRGAWSYAPGYAVWPKGRFIAVEAAEEGEFTTVGFLPPGRVLRINAVTKRAGQVLVAVTRRNGQPLPAARLRMPCPSLAISTAARSLGKAATIWAAGPMSRFHCDSA
jgi:hypothetical protein